MAIAFTNKVGMAGTTSLSPSTSFTPAAGSDRLLLVGVGSIRAHFGGGSDVAPNSVTFGGVGLTKAVEKKHVFSADVSAWASLWYLIAPATSAGSVQVNFAAAQANFGVAILAYTGVDQTSPIAGTQTAEGSTSPASITVASAAGRLVVDTVLSMQPTITKTGASQNPRHEEENINFEAAVGASDIASAASAVLGWTLSGSGFGNHWSQVAVDLIAAGAAPAATSLLLPRNPMGHMILR